MLAMTQPTAFVVIGPLHEKKQQQNHSDLHMRKQRRRSAVQCNSTADQLLCFRHTDSKIPLLYTCIQSFKLLPLFCDCTTWFVSDLVGNPNCCFLLLFFFFFFTQKAQLIRKDKRTKTTIFALTPNLAEDYGFIGFLSLILHVCTAKSCHLLIKTRCLLRLISGEFSILERDKSECCPL